MCVWCPSKYRLFFPRIVCSPYWFYLVKFSHYICDCHFLTTLFWLVGWLVPHHYSLYVFSSFLGESLHGNFYSFHLL